MRGRLRTAGRAAAGWLLLSVWPALALLPVLGIGASWLLGVF